MAGDHPGQVCRASGSGDNRFQTAGGCAVGVLPHPIGRTVGRNYPALMGQIELGQSLGCKLHATFPIGCAAHDYANKRRTI